MARQVRVEYPGAFYHITARGNEKKEIYKSDRDREKFLSYLEIANERFRMKIHGYCLMPNHYHLIVETPLPNLSRAMQVINTGYTMYYNIKRKRTGHLLQGRYKAILVEKDNYLMEVSRYVHLNPVRAKISKNPEEYKWSSYVYYLGKGKNPKYLDTGLTLSYFNASKSMYRKFVYAGIGEKENNLMKELKGGFILGDEDFVEEIKDQYLSKVGKEEDLPELRKLKKEYIPVEAIKECLKEELKKKQLTAYYLRKYTDETLQGIVKKVYKKKMSSSSISKIVNRIDKKRAVDRDFDRRMKKIEDKMSMSRFDPIYMR